MATIRKRGSTWQAQVRRIGFHPVSRSFPTKAEALAWARDKERAVDRLEAPPSASAQTQVRVGDLLARYEATVTAGKRGAASERYRLRTLQAHPISQVPLARLTPATIAGYRDDRLKLVQPGSVRREIAILQHCLEVARKEWGVSLPTNPAQQIALPSPQAPRERRLEPTEMDRLLSALAQTGPWYLRSFLLLCVETGMRRGELLSVRWTDVDLRQHTMRVSKTKNGHPRTIPLTPSATEILRLLQHSDDRIFPVSPNAVRLAWERLRRRAGVQDLRLHDLRHEAVSRFFEYGLSVPEVALISGHRDLRMLGRYTHLKPERIA